MWKAPSSEHNGQRKNNPQQHLSVYPCDCLLFLFSKARVRVLIISSKGKGKTLSTVEFWKERKCIFAIARGHKLITLTNTETTLKSLIKFPITACFPGNWKPKSTHLQWVKDNCGFPGGSIRQPTQEAQETLGRSAGEGMETHSSVLAWKIPVDGGAWWAAVRGVMSGARRSTQAS